jgi:hypothetical protein
MYMDATFDHSYECMFLAELPSSKSLPRYYYPGASTQGGQDGIVVEVKPEHGQSWLGTFAFGTDRSKGFSGIFTTPTIGRLCVVAAGVGYFVSADSPEEWERVIATPVMDVRSNSTCGIIVFADFTRLVAYGQSGLKWKTGRLAWDDLKITDMTANSIKGEYFDVPGQAVATFTVDLITGNHEGGVEKN